MELTDLARRLGATTLFSRLPWEQRVALLERSHRRQAAAGTWLARADQGLKNHIVLLAGELEARRSWSEDDGQQHSRAWRVGIEGGGPGFALLSASNSNIQVQTLTEADFLSVDSEELDEMLGWSHLGDHRALARNRKVFHKVPPENVQIAFERMVELDVASDQTVVTQGDPGDSYYIILSGDAEVWVTDPITDETRMATVLRDADGFGEEALLLGGTRTATVKMISPGRLLRLTKSDFDELLKPKMVAEVSAEQAHEMLQRGEVRLLDCRYDMEYEESRIPGAQLVPLNSLRREGVFTIDPEPTYIVYCRSGKRSSAAAFLLQERGIRAMSLAGGIKGWPYEVDSTPL